MGWAWALWVCHSTLSQAMTRSLSANDEQILDKCQAVRLQPGMVGAAPYVDNGNLVGLERDTVQGRLDRL